MFSRYRQSGVSLISLLIGLLISMVALLGMLSLYGTVVKSTVESTRDARIAGERSSALLVAGMQLQGAGYGIEGAALGDDLLLLAGASLDRDGGSLSSGTTVMGSGDGNTLIWRIRSDGATTWCRGLHAPSSAGQGGLYLLQSHPCSAITSVSTWEIRPLLIDDSDAVDHSLPIILSLTEHAAPGCSVLGIAGSGRISAGLHTTDRNGNRIDSTTCLLNFASGGNPP